MEENYTLPGLGGEKEIKNWHIWLILAAIATLVIIGIRFNNQLAKRVSPQEATQQAQSQMEAPQRAEVNKKATEPSQQPPLVAFAPQPEPPSPRIAIIIDDIGYNLDMARRFIELDQSLSFAVLPFTPHSQASALLAKEKGRDVLVHVPMEPQDYPEVDPGPGALMASMSSRELIDTLEKDLASIPQAIGVSNHMGSKLTANAQAMEVVMKYLKGRNLFFVDNLTAPNTVAYSMAKEAGINSARRTIFLDNVQDVQAISQNLMLLARKAREADGLIAIAHPQPATYQALYETLPRLRENGVRLVPVSALVK